MIGVAGVALGSYAAYAGNSTTMSVTATIAHDVSLSVIQDIDMGTITINPAATEFTMWSYDNNGKYFPDVGDAIVSADDATLGKFTANVPNKESTAGLNLIASKDLAGIENLFGGNDGSNFCPFCIGYTGEDNIFRVSIGDCYISDVSKVTPGSHSGTLTISYTAS